MSKLWYAEEPEAPTGKMVPKSDLIAWFRESAQTLKSNPPPEIQPDAPELPQVRVADCGCVLRADSLPVGYRFVATGTGDKRVMVYACPEHTRTRELLTPNGLSRSFGGKKKRATRPG